MRISDWVRCAGRALTVAPPAWTCSAMALEFADQNAEMGDAETRLVPDLVAVEGLDRHIAVAVAHVLVAIARPLPGFPVRLEQFAKAENPAVEIEHQLGIERVERDMGDAGNPRGRGGQSELALRQGHRIAFGIVNAHVAMLQIAVLRNDHAARIEGAVARQRLIHIVDRDPQMVEAELHAGLVQLLPLLEQGEVEAAVGEADIARRAAADFRHA